MLPDVQFVSNWQLPSDSFAWALSVLPAAWEAEAPKSKPDPSWHLTLKMNWQAPRAMRHRLLMWRTATTGEMYLWRREKLI